MRRRFILATLVAAYVSGAPTGAESTNDAVQETPGELTLTSGRLLPPARPRHDSGFRLGASFATPRNADGFALLSGHPVTALSGASCLCGDGIFANGFESGDTSAWSASSPLVDPN